MQEIEEGMFLWEPSETWKQQSNMVKYLDWLHKNKELVFNRYKDLWQWSVTEIETFWESLWQYFNISYSAPYVKVLTERKMPGALWFAGARLNYAEHIFRHQPDEKVAVIAKSEVRPQLQKLTWKELYEQTAVFAAALKNYGVKPGDRVVGFLPNIPETIIAFLACASIGAVWSCCSPDFGSAAVVDRFKQIEPKLLISADGYRYRGKDYQRIPSVQEIQKAIPSIENTIILPYIAKSPDIHELKNTVIWDTLLERQKNKNVIRFEQVAFDHPLWILYSSGTTGLPKAIVQGHGGILLEHLKQCHLQMNITKKDRFFWYTSTGWMMWNFLVSGLLTGGSIVLYDGHPGYPENDFMWTFAEETGITFFGTSAAYLHSCMNTGMRPKDACQLNKLKSIGSTGAPLSPEAFAWVYRHVKEDIWLSSLSGGTDICSAFVGGSPLLAVHAGEIQCRHLGASVKVFDESGKEIIDAVGELVVTEPMPSMPLYFWNDQNNKRYKSSYFETYSDVWRHGDLIKIKTNGSLSIYGRSDSTINRGGIRIGTSELYRAAANITGIEDCLAVDLTDRNNKGMLLLFVVLHHGVPFTKTLEEEIKQCIRENCSPRHQPDRIFQISEVPQTLNGKKLEVPVKKLLMGVPLEKAVNDGSMKNPKCLDFFIELKNQLSI
ncbi:acetoacetate--CoA ligase [Bacillus benzoevorans]|uniref:Acetoacetyl-CoA synthetase n=1 Tax=Bacillus benzoevorans TaxID=1456 RepID=A0A7X0LV86_9BACI|nr:acetoacetyl-CoA synthetase [Bacillus benzoevorans]